MLSLLNSSLFDTIFYLAPFCQDVYNSLATHTWLRNMLKGALVSWFGYSFAYVLQEILLFGVSNWICFKIGCLNSENLPPPPVQPIQRSWWLLMSSVEISTSITAPLVRQGFPFPSVHLFLNGKL